MTYLYIAGIAVILAGAWIYRSRVAELGRAAIDPGSRLRYANRRWVIEGTAGGRTVRYTTGTLGLLPGLTYLYVEAPVSAGFAVTDGEPVANVPEELAGTVAALRRRDGFRRLDAFDAPGRDAAVIGRVSWLAPGGGLMLRRYTKSGGDPAFVRDDLSAMLKIADAMAGGLARRQAAARH